MTRFRCSQCPKCVHAECLVTGRRVMPGAEACEYGRSLIEASEFGKDAGVISVAASPSAGDHDKCKRDSH